MCFTTDLSIQRLLPPPGDVNRKRAENTHELPSDIESHAADRQESQKQYYNRNSKPSKELPEGHTVLARDFSGSKTRWVRGRIKHGSGLMSYSISMEDGRTIRRWGHIRPQIDCNEAPEEERPPGLL